MTNCNEKEWRSKENSYYHGTLPTDRKDLMNAVIDALVELYNKSRNWFDENYGIFEETYGISKVKAAVRMLMYKFELWCEHNSKLDQLTDGSFINDLEEKLHETLEK